MQLTMMRPLKATSDLPTGPTVTETSVRDDVVLVAEAVLRRCGPLASWSVPSGYPNSLALSVIDSVQSVGVRYSSVERVVSRYRDHRSPEDADHDGADELLSVFSVLGVRDFADTIGTRNRTSSRGGVLKAEAIRQAAELLAERAPTTAALRANADASLEEAWRALPGQRSGITWRYLLMLAGVPGVKPDRMVRRFVARATDRPLNAFSVEELGQIVTLAAEHIGIRPTLADHLIWRAQSGRGSRELPTPALGEPLSRELLAEPETGTRTHVVGSVTSVRTLHTPAGLEWAQLEAQTELGNLPVAASPVMWARHREHLEAAPVLLIGDLCTKQDGRTGLWIRGTKTV